MKTYLLPTGDTVSLETATNEHGNASKLICDLCGLHIKLSMNGSMAYFQTHRGSKACVRNQKRAARDTEQLEQSQASLLMMVSCGFDHNESL